MTTQYNSLITSINTFRDKYFAFPGDLTNAQSFWGVAHATPATCVTTIGTGTQTCNGDGNGLISPYAPGANESYRFWQHLANAGLIEGTYRGTTDSSNNAVYTTASTATNSPKGKISSSLWFVYNWGTIVGDTWQFSGAYNNTIVFGRTNPDTWPSFGVFRPEELWNLDVKMDDGKPGLGTVLTNSLSACSTTTNGTVTSADYNLTNKSVDCGVFFVRAF